MLVETDRFLDLCGGQDTLTSLNSMTVQDRPNRSAVDAEFTGEFLHRPACLVPGDQVGLLRVGEVALRLERFGRLNWPIIWVELSGGALQESKQGLTVLGNVS